MDACGVRWMCVEGKLVLAKRKDFVLLLVFYLEKVFFCTLA